MEPARILTARTNRLLPRVIDEIGLCLKRGEDKLVLLVPEQYTLQAEAGILRRLDIPGFFALDVLSPSRLTERVFDRAGKPPLARIGAEGKAMAVQSLMEGLAPELSYYKRAAGRRGFARRMAEQIGAFKRAGQTPASVLELASRCGGAARGKLSDMAAIFNGYEEALAGQFVDGEDVQRAMLERLPASGVMDGARVWVYGFDLIVPSMVDLFCRAAKLSRAFTLALTWDRSGMPDGRLFAPARATLDRLERGFARAGVPFVQERVEDRLDAAGPIRYLERALFAGTASVYKGGDGMDSAIEYAVESTPDSEAERAAARVLRLIVDGVDPDDIRVLHANLDANGDTLARAFNRMGIPVYLDRKRPASAHPLFLGLMGAIDFASRVSSPGAGHSATAALSDWIRSGFSELTADEASALDAYARSHALDGARWLKPLDGPTAFQLSQAEETLRGKTEPLRRMAVEPLADLRVMTRQAERSGEFARALWRFTEEAGIYGKLTELYSGLNARGMALEASHTAQVWQLWLNLLDQLDALLAGKPVSSTLAAKIIRTGIESLDLGALPPEHGRVTIGQVGRAKPGRARAALILGLADGALAPGGEGLLTDAELLEAEAILDAPLGLDTRSLLALTNLNLLEAMAAPTDFLYVSCSTAGEGGERVQPSITMRRLARLFPAACQVDGGRPACLYSPGTALDAIGPALRSSRSDKPISGIWQIARTALEADPVWRDRLRGVADALAPDKPRPPLDVPLAAELYSRAKYSVTRLELFAACPYRHFVRFGLTPIMPVEPRVAANRAGSLLHRALETLLRECAGEATFPDLPREQVEETLERFMPRMLDAFENGLVRQNARMEAEGARIAATAKRAGWTAVKQLTVSAFRPMAFEYTFGLGRDGALSIELDGGGSIPLEGKIDRVDEWYDGAKRYLRVIDYKSGSRAGKGNPFDPTRFYEGLDLQLLLYLAAVIPEPETAKPAGAFLFKLDNPALTVEPDEPEALSAEGWLDKLERKRFSELKLRGVMLDDKRVAMAMDNAEPPLSVQKMYNKTDGRRAAHADLVSADDMDGMIRYAKRKAASLARRIIDGEVACDPARIVEWTACQWCDYGAVCQRDSKAAMRRLNVVNRDEMLANILRELAR
jgi:ATP-dependent helicase/nuclease subunit B